MYGCDLLFSKTAAEEVREVVRATPAGCVCETGGHCPLLPRGDALVALVAERIPLRVIA